MSEKITAVEVYTESTPNPESLKFVSNAMLLPNKFVEFKSVEEAKDSPLALELFNKPFVSSVFISNNFITIAKKGEYEWFEISPELRDFLKNYILSGKEILSASWFGTQQKEEEAVADDAESQIVALLDKYVKPAVEMDGGHISFKSFENGVVTVLMQGACSGCPSSTITLKNGIEGLLKRMVPGVESVVSEEG